MEKDWIWDRNPKFRKDRIGDWILIVPNTLHILKPATVVLTKFKLGKEGEEEEEAERWKRRSSRSLPTKWAETKTRYGLFILILSRAILTTKN